ncbi:MAG: cell division protein FtsQ/DivIB [Bacteroidia bacterium]
MNKGKIIKILKNVGIISLWAAMVSGLIVSLAFVNRQVDEMTCSKINVKIKSHNDLSFVDRGIVLKIIRDDGNENLILGKNISSLNISKLEHRLQANKMIQRVQVFTNLNGELNIDIIQREPILRILKADGTGFYIDKKGLKMPLSEHFTARVPVASGNIYERYSGTDSIQSFVCRELFTIATHVDKDAFWKAQIEQIFVNAENELVLIPKVGDHRIIFGNTQHLEEKFTRLNLFYKEGLKKAGWNKYQSINVSYNGQVVCVKNEKNNNRKLHQ